MCRNVSGFWQVQPSRANPAVMVSGERILQVGRSWLEASVVRGRIIDVGGRRVVITAMTRPRADSEAIELVTGEGGAGGARPG